MTQGFGYKPNNDRPRTKMPWPKTQAQAVYQSIPAYSSQMISRIFSDVLDKVLVYIHLVFDTLCHMTYRQDILQQTLATYFVHDIFFCVTYIITRPWFSCVVGSTLSGDPRGSMETCKRAKVIKSNQQIGKSMILRKLGLSLPNRTNPYL